MCPRLGPSVTSVTGSFSSQEKWRSFLHTAWMTASISKPGLRTRKKKFSLQDEVGGKFIPQNMPPIWFFIWQLYFSKLWCWNTSSLLIEYQSAECLKPVNMLSGVHLTAPVRKLHLFHGTIGADQFLSTPHTPVSPCLPYSISPSLTHLVNFTWFWWFLHIVFIWLRTFSTCYPKIIF